MTVMIIGFIVASLFLK
ncbi:hypothetical protein [Priestia aryabhattai]|nr:hypothetical protein [Priestia aryabhattai]